MKDYFKHKYGYLNIDSENIYFTNSGNWGETHDLLENKTDSTKHSFFNRHVTDYILVFLIVVINFLLLYGIIELFGSLASSFIIIGWIIYHNISKQKNPFKPNFLIPIIKIKTLEIIEGNNIKIIYRDIDDIETAQIVKLELNNSKEIISKLSLILSTEIQ